MNSAWTKNAPKDTHDELEQLFKENKRIRKHIISILEDKIEVSESERIKKSKYELASWGLYQADSNGFRRALEEVIKILTD